MHCRGERLFTHGCLVALKGERESRRSLPFQIGVPLGFSMVNSVAGVDGQADNEPHPKPDICGPPQAPCPLSIPPQCPPLPPPHPPPLLLPACVRTWTCMCMCAACAILCSIRRWIGGAGKKERCGGREAKGGGRQRGRGGREKNGKSSEGKLIERQCL